MKYKIRFLIVFIICFSLLSNFIKPLSVMADSKQTSLIDAVLVVDDSGSMRSSDKDDLASEAVKMFIDMCHARGDRAAIITYGDKIINQSNLRTMNTVDDKNALKSMSEGLKNSQKTDIGLALKTAVELLGNGHDASHKPVIVLLSDGKNDPARNEESSINDRDNAIKLAKDKGYPVYTIGLNYDGSVNKKEMNYIAKSTGAKDFITKTAEELPSILRGIFADNLKLKVVSAGTITANGEFQDVKFKIPNNNVVEGNISILSGNPVKCILVDNNNKEVSVPSKNVYYTVSKKYSMIKLLKPAEGEWTLKVKGVSGDKIDINLVYNYDLQLTFNASPTTKLNIGDNINIETFVISNGQKMQDKELYKELKAKLIVKNLSNNKVQEYDLSNDGMSFKGNYNIKENGNYELKTRVDSQSFYRESNTIKISAKNKAPIVTKTRIISGLIGLVLLALITAASIYYKKANKRFTGEVKLEVIDRNTGSSLPPQYRKLVEYKGTVSVYELLGLKDEYKETENIKFVPGKNDVLILMNKSECKIDKSGRRAQGVNDIEISDKERIRIILPKVRREITIEYYLS